MYLSKGTLVLALFLIGQMAWAQSPTPPKIEKLAWEESVPGMEWVATTDRVVTWATFARGGLAFRSLLECPEDSKVAKATITWVVNRQTTFFGINCSDNEWGGTAKEVSPEFVENLPKPLQTHLRLFRSGK